MRRYLVIGFVCTRHSTSFALLIGSRTHWLKRVLVALMLFRLLSLIEYSRLLIETAFTPLNILVTKYDPFQLGLSLGLAPVFVP